MTTTELALDSTSSSALARLETARGLLTEVRSLDEVKAIHDLAEAARVYARQAHLSSTVRHRVAAAAKLDMSFACNPLTQVPTPSERVV